MKVAIKYKSVRTIGARQETVGKAAQMRQTSVSNVPERELTKYGGGCQGECKNANNG
jgi:hypothetical protein